MSLTARNALISLGITVLIIGTVVYAIDYLDRARLAQLTLIGQQLSIDTLSLDTEFSLLASAPCDEGTSTELTSELGSFGDRLAFAEHQLGKTNPEVVTLKKQYTLLEIRDYLITKQLASACHVHPVTVLYFYSNDDDCAECDKAGFALSYLRDTFPNLRVYAFDYHLDLGALQTLIKINKVKAELPAFIISGKTSYGFTTLVELETQFPKGALATSTPQK